MSLKYLLLFSLFSCSPPSLEKGPSPSSIMPSPSSPLLKEQVNSQPIDSLPKTPSKERESHLSEHSEKQMGEKIREQHFFFPAHSSSSPLILLFQEEETMDQMRREENSFPLLILSLPASHFQYEIIEREFWESLWQLYSLHPELERLPRVLVGEGRSTHLVLSLAHSYRSWFTAVLFSGGSFSLSQKNLDTIPIWCYASPSADQPCYWGDLLIDRLQRRGNLHAENHRRQSLQEALLLCTEQFALPSSWQIPPHTVIKEHRGWVTPWLRIARRYVEGIEETLSIQKRGSQLILANENVAAWEILSLASKGFPFQEIQSCLWNQREEFLPPSSRSLLGSLSPTWKNKAEVPGEWRNFFSYEPVYYVCEENEREWQAGEVSRENFFPLCQGTFSLSEYDPKMLPPHRALFWGEKTTLKEQLERKGLLFPLLDSLPRLTLEHFPQVHSLAALLLSPPEEESPLQLAAFFFYSDVEGKESLQQYFASPLSGENRLDWMAWGKKKREDTYIFLEEECLNSYWGRQENARVSLISSPCKEEREWQEELLHRSGADALWTFPFFENSFQTLPRNTNFLYFSLIDEEMNDSFLQWKAQRKGREIFMRKAQERELPLPHSLLIDIELLREMQREGIDWGKAESYFPYSLLEISF